MMRLLLARAAVITAVAPAYAQDNGVELFEARIRPVLATKCYSCHTQSKLGGLEVDSREALLRGGKSGPAIVVGEPDQSLLMRLIRSTDKRTRMPMSGEELTAAEVDAFTAWIRMGAPWPADAPKQTARTKGFVLSEEQRRFWSFQPIRMPAVPVPADNKAWARTPIDNFILAKLEEKGLAPAGAASKRTLIRRATFDLTGLPPTPEEVSAFENDTSPDAFVKVVDRLLASPRYGERWGRHWLDVARFGEADLQGTRRGSYAQAWRYRDWVIEAFNKDMPYETFVRAQIAADLMDGSKREEYLPALGLFGLGPWLYRNAPGPEARALERDDRIDVVTRGFLGLTVSCARCHDHKYDPISQKDYYALSGVFLNTEFNEYPLVEQAVAEKYQKHQQKIREKQAELTSFLNAQGRQLADIFAAQISRYMQAAWKVIGPEKQDVVVTAKDAKLDQETLEKWVRYLKEERREHPFLQAFDDFRSKPGPPEALATIADDFQKLVLSVIEQEKRISEELRVIRAKRQGKERPPRTKLPNGTVLSDESGFVEETVDIQPLERDRYVLWLDMFELTGDAEDYPRGDKVREVLLYKGEKLDRFLGSEAKKHADALRAELAELRKAAPPPFPYIMGIADTANRIPSKVHVRGNPYNLGEEVPLRFVEVLSDKTPKLYERGSGRLQLANDVASHPLATRVYVNRVWAHHFGRGIVGTPSNFGLLGEKPSYPELLEYLAARFQDLNGSTKALHREIMLSAVYQTSSGNHAANAAIDPDNRLLWRANQRRLDIEALRDSMLLVSGSLDLKMGGPSAELRPEYKRRTVYGTVSRYRLDGLLALFDFPDPMLSNEQRMSTNVPTQRLFYLNSDFVWRQAEAFARRVEAAGDNRARIEQAYRILFQRPPSEEELQAGSAFLAARPDDTRAWTLYAQVLLAANENLFI